MKSIPLRAQLGLVATSYAVVLATAALLVYERHLQYVNHPEDIAASSGMYAAGDWMLDGWPTQARFWLEWGCSYVTDRSRLTN